MGWGSGYIPVHVVCCAYWGFVFLLHFLLVAGRWNCSIPKVFNWDFWILWIAGESFEWTGWWWAGSHCLLSAGCCQLPVCHYRCKFQVNGLGWFWVIIIRRRMIIILAISVVLYLTDKGELYKINSNVYVKTSKMINHIVIILYS